MLWRFRHIFGMDGCEGQKKRSKNGVKEGKHRTSVGFSPWCFESAVLFSVFVASCTFPLLVAWWVCSKCAVQLSLCQSEHPAACCWHAGFVYKACFSMRSGGMVACTRLYALTIQQRFGFEKKNSLGFGAMY